MKILKIVLVLLITIPITACGEKGDASIKDNSSRFDNDEIIEDYSLVTSEELHKQIVAHYDVYEYKKGKAKLTFLMQDRPDLVETLGLEELSEKYDEKLILFKEADEVDTKKENKSRVSKSNALDNMRSYDDGPFIVYLDKTSPKFDSNETFHAYYTKSREGRYKLFLRIKYISTEWLNIENYLITVDELDYDLKGDGVVKTETKGKKKYKHETLDDRINSLKDLELLETIANGKEVKAVYIGPKEYKERVLTKEQIKAIGNVLDAYLYTIGKSMEELKDSYSK